jgi:ParB/RepB/Spo0J family partition protein
MELKVISIEQITESPIALRKVNKTSEEFLQLVDSVRAQGVLNAIVVRENDKKGADDKPYMLVDGLHRFTAAQAAGLKDIPCNVVALSGISVLEAQIMTNIHKVETRPVEYTKQLQRILALDPTLTISQLSAQLSKSPAWLNQRLNLLKLDPAFGKLVDEGTLKLANAYGLAKLPVEEQNSHLQDAIGKSTPEFLVAVNSRLKEIRDARAKGRTAGPSQFVAVPHLRKLGELKTELDKREIGPMLIKQLNIKKIDDAFNLGIAWALHMDAPTVQSFREKFEKEEAARVDAAKARAKERAQKKMDEAKKAAEEATKAAELAG